MTESLARPMWWVVEPVHAVVRAAIDQTESFAALEFPTAEMGYFASRAAPFGAASAELIASSFYVFEPGFVRESLPVAWQYAQPQLVLTTRLHAVDELFWTVFEDEIRSDRIDRAAELTNRAVAMEEPLGRPVFAAHMALDWPTVPHLALWHGVTLLREHRGDGHMAVLMNEGLDGCAANVLAVAAGATTAELLREERGWSDDAWADASAALAERGWLDDTGALTSDGEAIKARIEQRTDELAARPYVGLGLEECEELRLLLTDLARTIVKAGVLGFPNAAGLPNEVTEPVVIDLHNILGPDAGASDADASASDAGSDEADVADETAVIGSG